MMESRGVWSRPGQVLGQVGKGGALAMSEQLSLLFELKAGRSSPCCEQAPRMQNQRTCKASRPHLPKNPNHVWADKIGTQREADGRPCFEGNYVPVWVPAASGQGRYAVSAKWAEVLWKQRKLSHQTYQEYLYLSRDGVLPRKRNLEEVWRWEQERAQDEEREHATKRVRAKLFRPFPEQPAATAWLQMFGQELDRYPFLIVLAPSRAGKTEYAKSLFTNPLVLQIGDLDHFPDGLRHFDRHAHDAVILDDLRDFKFCVLHQEKLQGKVSTKFEFATTASGMFAYSKWLWKVPLVFTANYTTRNLELLRQNDFLGRPENRVLIELAGPLLS